MIRTLLVDDEEPALVRMRQLLGAFDDVEIVGEARDGLSAIESVETLRPDLVLLDVQMPGCTGIEVAASLGEPRPRIVFCTAYDEYAVDAFELHAVDYLLKPVNRSRLRSAVDRVRRRGVGDDEALDRAATRAGSPTRFLAKRRTHFVVVPREEVLAFVSDGGLTQLRSADGHAWMQPTLNELERRVDPEEFFRVSRGAIVRIDAIRRVHPVEGGGGEVVLADDSVVTVSRRRYKDLLDRIES